MSRSTIAWNTVACSLLIALSLGACGKIKETEPAETTQTRAEAKRHKDACASSTAYDRMKRVVFDQARAQSIHRTNLNTLEAFSFVRMEGPVVKGWDPTLDVTRCKGHFILDVPPGSEQALGGERRLTADIEYTAQGAADASGLVYVMTGEEAIVSKLAAFNLSDATYRPLPAVDTTSPKTALAASDTGPSEVSSRVPFSESGGSRTNRESEDVALSAIPAETRVPDPRAVANATEPQAIAPSADEDTVRTFYNALGTGRGDVASAQVVPQKRSSRTYSADAITRFYGRLSDPLRLTSTDPLGVEATESRIATLPLGCVATAAPLSDLLSGDRGLSSGQSLPRPDVRTRVRFSATANSKTGAVNSQGLNSVVRSDQTNVTQSRTFAIRLPRS